MKNKLDEGLNENIEGLVSNTITDICLFEYSFDIKFDDQEIKDLIKKINGLDNLSPQWTSHEKEVWLVGHVKITDDFLFDLIDEKEIELIEPKDMEDCNEDDLFKRGEDIMGIFYGL